MTSGWILIGSLGIWAASRAVSSGDLWIALGCGPYLLTHGVGRIDPFSFTSIPGSWVNQNWMSHILFTWIHRAAGLAGLGIWRALVSITIVALGVSTASALGTPRVFALIAAIGIGLCGRPFFDTRPNLNSVLMAAILLRWLVGIEKRPVRGMWPIAIVMILWANLHGGFLFGVIAISAASAALILRRVRRRSVASWPFTPAIPFAATACALVSPYFTTNLTHPWEISASPAAKHWRGVEEWRPPYLWDLRDDAGVRVFWIACLSIVLIATIALIARRVKGGKGVEGIEGNTGTVGADGTEGVESADAERRPIPDLLPLGAVALAAFALAAASRRFIPLFTLAAFPWILAAGARLAPALARRRPSAIVLPAVAAIALIGTGIDVRHRLFVPNAIWPASEDWASRLVRADEQPIDAVRFLNGTGLTGHVFTNWTWGGYLLYGDPIEGGAPRYRIYLDGRAQAAYPVAISKDYVEIEKAGAAGETEPVRSFMDRYKIDICVFDRRSGGLIASTMQLPGWIALYGDDRAVVAVRSRLAEEARPSRFPDRAVERACAALRIRTTLASKHSGADSPPDMGLLSVAFDAAVESCRLRPTSIGITEMTRISIAVPGEAGNSMRRRAAEECDRIQKGPIDAARYEDLRIRANTAQCRSVLARSLKDPEETERQRVLARDLAAQAEKLVGPYLR
jgi:hypothetical protein